MTDAACEPAPGQQRMIDGFDPDGMKAVTAARAAMAQAFPLPAVNTWRRVFWGYSDSLPRWGRDSNDWGDGADQINLRDAAGGLLFSLTAFDSGDQEAELMQRAELGWRGVAPPDQEVSPAALVQRVCALLASIPGTTNLAGVQRYLRAGYHGWENRWETGAGGSRVGG